MAVPVRVVPGGRPRGVIVRELDGVVEGSAGLDREERVVAVAVREDVQTVGVQVGRLVQVVSQGDAQTRSAGQRSALAVLGC